MNNEEAEKIVSDRWNDLLIANWFDKEWFEMEYDIELTEDEYKRIVEMYNDSNMCDIITKEIQDWIRVNGIIEEIKGDK